MITLTCWFLSGGPLSNVVPLIRTALSVPKYYSRSDTVSAAFGSVASQRLRAATGHLRPLECEKLQLQLHPLVVVERQAR